MTKRINTVAATAVATPLAAAAGKEIKPPPPERIDAELLIPGRGDPIENASLIHRGGKIEYAGSTARLATEHKDLEPYRVKVLMPGLWDCHVHYYGTLTYSQETLYSTSQVASGARIARDLAATLNAGYTSVRELAGYGAELAKIIDQEHWLAGPRIYSAVSILSETSGHGDAGGVTPCHFHDAITHGLPAYVCDGVDECIKAVRTQVRRGAEVIKVAASGGIADAGADFSSQQFSDEELRAIVDEAARHKLAVAAHCHGKEGIMAALRAGCRTIEHASYLDQEAIDLILEKDAIVVATRGAVEVLASYPEIWTPEQYAKILAISEQHLRSYRLAIQSGVPVALGTDVLISSTDIAWRHGMNAREIEYAVQAGLSPAKAIEAATAMGPLTLGPRAPRSGQLREGYDADFIALDRNPLDNVKVLQDVDRILHVWRTGVQVKRDGCPINIIRQISYPS